MRNLSWKQTPLAGFRVRIPGATLKPIGACIGGKRRKKNKSRNKNFFRLCWNPTDTEAFAQMAERLIAWDCNSHSARTRRFESYFVLYSKNLAIAIFDQIVKWTSQVVSNDSAWIWHRLCQLREVILIVEFVAVVESGLLHPPAKEATAQVVRRFESFPQRLRSVKIIGNRSPILENRKRGVK